MTATINHLINVLLSILVKINYKKCIRLCGPINRLACGINEINVEVERCTLGYRADEEYEDNNHNNPKEKPAVCHFEDTKISLMFFKMKQICIDNVVMMGSYCVSSDLVSTELCEDSTESFAGSLSHTLTGSLSQPCAGVR